MQIIPVASSSDGNCAVIKSKQSTILIDCGISMKALVASAGLDTVQNLDAIFVTHEHSDHIRGVGPLGRKYDELPVFINKLSFQSRRQDLKNINRRDLPEGKPVRLLDFWVIPFRVEHDSANTFGFFVEESNGDRLVYMLDTGNVNSEAREFMQDANMLFIESNYNEKGLREYPGYSPSHKERIRRSHLETEQTMETIDRAGVDSFKEIYLGHISPRTNLPGLVRDSFARNFPDYSGKISTAPQWCSYTLNKTPWVRVVKAG